jgi:hypothetical protein
MVGYPAFLADKALSAEDEQTLERVLHGWCVRYGVPKDSQAQKDTEATIREWMRNGVADTVSLNALLQPWP